MTNMEHPHAAFMERAIYLSRVAGLEKRTGVQVHRLATRSPTFYDINIALLTVCCVTTLAGIPDHWVSTVPCRRLLWCCYCQGRQDCGRGLQQRHQPK